MSIRAYPRLLAYDMRFPEEAAREGLGCGNPTRKRSCFREMVWGIRRETGEPSVSLSRFIVFRGDKVASAALLSLVCLFALVIVLSLLGCGSSEPAASPFQGGAEQAGAADSSNDAFIGTTSGPGYVMPDQVLVAEYDPEAAQGNELGAFDVSHLAQGYVGVSAHSSARLKFQVIKGEMSYNYDLPSDGTPIVVPLNMGDGMYTFRVMQNTTGTSYVEIASLHQAVTMDTEFEPYLRPNVFCNYNKDSAVVSKARELAADATNTGEVVRSIYSWIVDNITYDTEKAKELAQATGYIPNPDETLTSKKGICFDYSSMAAAMFRSLGIPARIITGYVSPNNLYHAWNMIFIDGKWMSVDFEVDPNTWTRTDLTFAAADPESVSTSGDGTEYTDRYVY